MQALAEKFANPGAAYRGKPFWAWNGELRKDELIRQIHVMKEMGFGGFFMHSRSGLATEYLGEEWFELINVCADEAEKLGMEAWLYDEDRWPSGSAGGKVTVDPQYRMKSLCLTESDDAVWTDETVALFAGVVDGDGITAYRKLDKGQSPAPGEKALRFEIRPDECNSNYNGTTYIDTMSRAAVDRFIELTHEEYARHCGDRLGRNIPGIFTDEPHRGFFLCDLKREGGKATCSAPWTDDLAEEFAKRYGYDLMARLPELFYRSCGEPLSRLKRDYIDLTDNLFIERFADPLNEWCEKHNMIFTGHVLHEDSLTNQTVPHGSLMRFYGHMGYPGIDLLCEGNECYWVAKQIQSACRQQGKARILSEMYGATGWQFDLKGHRVIGDWQALFGVNLRCQHLSWYTMEGEAKRDYPGSILHQSPWYPDYKHVEDYYARLGMLLMQGETDCDVCVINPIESVWARTRMGWARSLYPVADDVKAIEAIYAETFHALQDARIDFDYGEEQMLAQMGAIEDGKLIVGRMRYAVAVVSGADTLRETTVRLLEDFANAGGRIVFAGEVPGYVDAEPSERVHALATHPNAERVSLVELSRAVRAHTREAARLSGEGKRPVFMQTRVLDDGSTIVAVLNTDKDNPTGEMRLSVARGARAVELWDCETGERRLAGEGSEIVFALHPAELRVYRFAPEKDASLAPLPSYRETGKTIIRGPLTYEMGEENALVLDFVSWRRKGEAWRPAKEALFADDEIRDSVGIERRGGEMLQPWYAKKFDNPEYGEIELRYAFDIDTLPDAPVTLAAERPDLCRYFVNGAPVFCPDENAVWIDDCFKRMPIPKGVLRAGENEVTVETTFRRTSNIEAVYLLGMFGVRLDGVKKTMVGISKTLDFGRFDPQNLPFYTGTVTYLVPTKGIEIGKTDRILLKPTGFYGACVRVADENGRALGTMLWDPYEADVTDAVRAGQTLRVTVVSTRRNTFGPLHIVPALFGPCGPTQFKGWGDHWHPEYSLVPSGIDGLELAFEVLEK